MGNLPVDLVFDGLAVGFKRHIAGLYQTLSASAADPGAVERFERGIEKALAVYETAVAVATSTLNKEKMTDV